MLVVVLGYFILLLGVNYYSYQLVGLLMGIPYLGVLFASIAGFFLVLFFSLSSVSTTLYQSKDLNMLRPLALDEKSLVLSRLVLVYLLHAPVYYLITLPALVVALWIDGFSLLYGVGCLLFILLGPILPLGVSAILSMLLIHLCKGRRFKTMQEMSSMILFVVLIVAMSAFMTRNMGDSSLLDFNYEAMIASISPLVGRIEALFPLFVMQATMLFSLSSLIWYLIISTAVLCFIVWYIPKKYTTHLSFLLSNQQRHTTSAKKEVLKRRSSIKALLKREIVIIRTYSVFTFELVGELLIPLLLIVIYLATGVMDEIAVLLDTVQDLEYLPQLIFLLFLLVANFCMLSSTSVSRQGSLFVLDRLYPIDPKTFVQSKVILHLILVFIPNILYMSVAMYFMKQDMRMLLYYLPLSLCAIFSCANMHLAIDYKMPNLQWTLPQQAMKSNINGLLGMLSSLVLEVVLALVLIGSSLLGLPSFVGPLSAGFILIVVSPLSYKVAVHQAKLALSR